jgi:hypothetical protein
MQGIDRARVDGSGGSDDQKRRKARADVAVDRGLQQIDAHRAGGIDRDRPQMRGADAGELHRLRNAPVRLCGGIGDELFAGRRKAGATDLVSQRSVARDEQAKKIRGRGAGHENSAGA